MRRSAIFLIGMQVQNTRPQQRSSPFGPWPSKSKDCENTSAVQLQVQASRHEKWVYSHDGDIKLIKIGTPSCLDIIQVEVHSKQSDTYLPTK